MPTIGAAVTEEIKVKFETVARIRNVTPSRLAASLVLEFLNENGRDNTVVARQASRQTLPEKQLIARDESKTKQVFVRLEPYYYEALGRFAAEREWYRGTYLANLFYAHADRRPVLCDTEINAVRQVARQLSNLGRNVNQIAKKINTSDEHAHLVLSLDFDLVKMLIDLENTAIRELIAANIRGWGVNDEQT